MVQETIQNPEKTDSGYGDKLLAFRSYEAGVLKVVYVIENRDCAVTTVIWD